MDQMKRGTMIASLSYLEIALQNASSGCGYTMYGAVIGGTIQFKSTGAGQIIYTATLDVSGSEPIIVLARYDISSTALAEIARKLTEKYGLNQFIHLT